MDELRYWRSLSEQEKQALKDKHNITIVTFSFIEKVYLELV